MKKMMFAVAAALMATMTFANAVNWQFTGSNTQEGWTVYALTAMPEKITSITDISSKSSDVIAKHSRIYAAVGTLDGFSEASGTKVDYYLVLTGSSDGADYYYSIAQSGTVYDPTSTDQPVVGEFNGKSIGAIGSEGWTKISGATPGPGPGGDVPEPTSGLLLALGGAALALRRKQK